MLPLNKLLTFAMVAITFASAALGSDHDGVATSDAISATGAARTLASEFSTAVIIVARQLTSTTLATTPTTPTTTTTTQSQYPTITTYWVESLLTTSTPDSTGTDPAKLIPTTVTTWVEVAYTQTFAVFPGATAAVTEVQDAMGTGTGTATDGVSATAGADLTGTEGLGLAVSSGTVGLGNIKGSVGSVRTEHGGVYAGGAGVVRVVPIMGGSAVVALVLGLLLW